MIKPTKVFLNYPSVNLLGQHVNSLGLTTAEDKLAAIAAIKYPVTLGDVKHFLGLTGYLCLNVYCYAQIAMQLQNLKILLLKSAPIADRQWKIFVSKTKLPTPTNAEFASFQMLKDALLQAIMLVHYSLDRVLWIGLDISKEFGFGVIVFHINDKKAALAGK